MNINPEVKLRALAMIYPDWDFEYDGSVLYRSFKGKENWHRFGSDLLTPGTDTFLLERALKKEGLAFQWIKLDNGTEFFHAYTATKNWVGQSDESDTLLLLKCVSAQTNLPMSTRQE